MLRLTRKAADLARLLPKRQGLLSLFAGELKRAKAEGTKCKQLNRSKAAFFFSFSKMEVVDAITRENARLQHKSASVRVRACVRLRSTKRFRVQGLGMLPLSKGVYLCTCARLRAS